MTDADYMCLAIRLARRGIGRTSPNPMVGAVLTRKDRVIGQGWHRKAGGPHAEVVAIRNALRTGNTPEGSTLYVTLEPCSTHGRTPPCTEAIMDAGIKRVVIGTMDSNPKHRGRAVRILRRSGIVVESGVHESECRNINPAFNHWVVHGTPLVTVKAAMTLDGKIGTQSGESKWITGEKARAYSMQLRRSHDAILVGINTILADDPSLTIRVNRRLGANPAVRSPRRIILDSLARTPLNAKVIADEHANRTTIVVGRTAPQNRVEALAGKVQVWQCPSVSSSRSRQKSSINLKWLLDRLGEEEVSSLLVEGGGEVNASFVHSGLANRVAFFYAPKILGGKHARPSVAGRGAERWSDVIRLQDVRWTKMGDDLLMTAAVQNSRRKN